MTNILNYVIGGESNAYKWTTIAFDLINADKIAVMLTGPAGNHVIASGPCPRCDHDLDYSFTDIIVVPQGLSGMLSTATDALSDDDAMELDPYVTVPVLCQCKKEHPGRPDKSRGCGIIFNTELLAP